MPEALRYAYRIHQLWPANLLRPSGAQRAAMKSTAPAQESKIGFRRTPMDAADDRISSARTRRAHSHRQRGGNHSGQAKQDGALLESKRLREQATAPVF